RLDVHAPRPDGAARVAHADVERPLLADEERGGDLEKVQLSGLRVAIVGRPTRVDLLARGARLLRPPKASGRILPADDGLEVATFVGRHHRDAEVVSQLG